MLTLGLLELGAQQGDDVVERTVDLVESGHHLRKRSHIGVRILPEKLMHFLDGRIIRKDDFRLDDFVADILHDLARESLLLGV